MGDNTPRATGGRSKNSGNVSSSGRGGGVAPLVDVPEPLWNMFYNSFGWLWWGVARPSDITPLVSGSARRLGRPAHAARAQMRHAALLQQWARALASTTRSLHTRIARRTE